jgi:integrase
MFTMAITWGKSTDNPVSQVKFFREENGRTRFLTNEEEEQLLSQCGPHLTPIVITALHTGFRKSEILSLAWGNVNFRQRTITVEAAYAKNGEARSVPMTERLTETLRELPGKDNASNAVFLTRMGTPYRRIAKNFARACNRAGLTDVTFHELRHTFASRLVMAGVDLPTVQALLGHESITMTMRYAHLAPEHVRAAVSVLDQHGTSSATISATVH